jgi:hypothetical protein
MLLSAMPAEPLRYGMEIAIYATTVERAWDAVKKVNFQPETGYLFPGTEAKSGKAKVPLLSAVYLYRKLLSFALFVANHPLKIGGI